MKPFNPKHRDTSSGQIVIAFYRIAQAIDLLFRNHAKKMRLSPAQIHALLFLKYARRGVRTIGGLAQRLGTSYATSSGVVDALESKQLVQRIPLPEDQRVVTLQMTSKGERKVKDLEDVLDELENAVNAISQTEQEALLHATQSIVRHLYQAGFIHIYEMCWNCQFFRRNAHPKHPLGPHHCAFMDAPLAEADSNLECPDFIPLET